YYKLGGEGLISVVANAIPQETQKLFDLVQKDDTKTAENLRDQILSLLNDLGVDVNPIPVKALTAVEGFGNYEVRLPLVTLEDSDRQKLEQAYEQFIAGGHS
ncbi:dihydrodipicolinate synthase family protein, partial [Bacillus subtilis]|uniref:dihydrodipicolinate synthase family protein n=1 Tax=Bacillus subtilis TaxID=1423 RepID=UPI0039813478